MRTAILLGSIIIAESISKAPVDQRLGNFVSLVLGCFIAMDIVQFIRGE